MVSAAETVSHDTPLEDLLSCLNHRLTGCSSMMESRSRQSNSMTLLTIPAEIRLDIYNHSFATPTKTTLRRRDEIDDEELQGKLSTSLIPSLLATCHQIYHEALPIFYGSLSFYITVPYSMFAAIEAYEQPSVYGSRLLYAKDHSELITQLSLGWDTLDMLPTGNDHVDQTVAAGINFFVEECPRLRTLTLNFLPSIYSIVASCHIQGGPATAKAPRTLRNRLDELTIIVLGSHIALYGLRRSVGEDESVWGHKIYPNGPWPGMSLMREHQNALGEKQRLSRPINKYTLAWNACRPGVVDEIIEASLASSTNVEQDEAT